MAYFSFEDFLYITYELSDPSFKDWTEENAGPDYCQCETCRMWYPSIKPDCPLCVRYAKFCDVASDIEAPIRVYLRVNYGEENHDISYDSNAIIWDVLRTEFGLRREHSRKMPINCISNLFKWAHNYNIAASEGDRLFLLDYISEIVDRLSGADSKFAFWSHLKSALLVKFPMIHAIQAISADWPALSGSDSNPDALPDLVTLAEAAAMVHRTKRTLEIYKTKGKLPAPAVDGGGGGKFDLYEWKTLGPCLESITGIKLPPRFPGNMRS